MSSNREWPYCDPTVTYLDLCRVLVGCLGGIDSQHVSNAAGDEELNVTASVCQEKVVCDVHGQGNVLLWVVVGGGELKIKDTHKQKDNRKGKERLEKHVNMIKITRENLACKTQAWVDVYLRV